MDTRSDRITDRLLAQYVPGSEEMARYRAEVDAILERNERRLRREKWRATILWLFCVALATAFLGHGASRFNEPAGAFFAALACCWLLGGAVELLKHFINRARVETLKELKRLELEILELRESLHGRGSG
jgi:hypothetical protein